MTTTRRAAALVPPAIAALVALMLVALAAVAATRSSDRLANSPAGLLDDGAVASALSAATTDVGTVLSYDYRHLDRDFARAEALLTPTFRKQYLDTTEKGVRPLAGKYKAISTAQVTSAGLVDGSRDKAVVLVFVSQTATNSQLTAPRLDRARIKATLVRGGDGWLIANLEPI